MLASPPSRKPGMNAAEHEMTADAAEPHRDNINRGSQSPDWAVRNTRKNDSGTTRKHHRTRITGRDAINGTHRHTPTSTRGNHWTWSMINRKSP